MKKRLVQDKINKILKTFGGVLIYGPQLCGKTYLAENITNSQYYMQDLGIKNIELIAMNIEHKILDGEFPRLIDEWQIVPEIWDKIRSKIDQSHGVKNLYVLTGSNTLYGKEKVIHSGAGRIARIKMDTLTYCEFHETGSISLKDLIANKVNDISTFKNEAKIDEIIKYILYGGWPSIINNESFNFAKQYINSIINMNVDSTLRYKNNIALDILKSISRLNTSEIKKQTILKDINEIINPVTLDKYLQIFKDIFLIFELNSWSSNIRSKYKIRTTSKKYLCDTSLGLSCLKINTTDQLLNDLNTLGIYFENLVIKDLSCFCETNDAEIFFYRNEADEEIDCIIHMPNGEWAAIEIKLTNEYEKIKDVVKNMNNTISKIQPKSGNAKPSLKMIITSHGLPYKIDDTYIIPFQLLNLF